MLSTQERIEQLEKIQEYIERTERHLKYHKSRHPDMTPSKIEFMKHNEDIYTKAIAYWKRRFNRVLLTLGYSI